MKLLIINGKIIGTADDSYTGPSAVVTAPEGFDIARVSQYEVIDDSVSLSKPLIWEEIKKLRDYKTQNNGYQTNSKWFHSDTFSRTQQMGLVMMGASIPSGLQWKTMDGSFIEMTLSLAGQVFAAAATSDQALFAYAEVLKAQVEIDTSTDITAGWPAGFGE